MITHLRVICGLCGTVVLRRCLATREVAGSTPGRSTASIATLGKLFTHTCFCHINLVPVAAQRCPAAGKLTVGLDDDNDNNDNDNDNA